MDDPLMARLLDAALPFVCGRRLIVHGLTDEYAHWFDAWKDDGSGQVSTLILAKSSERIQVGIEAARGCVVLILPGLVRAPELPGLEVLDVQYAFEDEVGVADARAEPTRPPDADWPMAETAGPVWLDTARPGRPLGCIVIAKVSDE